MYDTIILSDKQLPAEIMPATAREFFDAAQQGIKAQHKIKVRAIDYNGEDKLIYRDTTYAIYRTYSTGDWIELHITVKIGLQKHG